jgi:hypothetical protein
MVSGTLKKAGTFSELAASGQARQPDGESIMIDPRIA